MPFLHTALLAPFSTRLTCTADQELLGWSVLLSQHDGQHARGYAGIGRVRRVPGQGKIVVVNLLDHLVPGGREAGAIALAIGIVVGVEGVEARDRSQDRGHLLGRESRDARRHDDPAAAP